MADKTPVKNYKGYRSKGFKGSYGISSRPYKKTHDHIAPYLRPTAPETEYSKRLKASTIREQFRGPSSSVIDSYQNKYRIKIPERLVYVKDNLEEHLSEFKIPKKTEIKYEVDPETIGKFEQKPNEAQYEPEQQTTLKAFQELERNLENEETKRADPKFWNVVQPTMRDAILDYGSRSLEKPIPDEKVFEMIDVTRDIARRLQEKEIDINDKTAVESFLKDVQLEQFQRFDEILRGNTLSEKEREHADALFDDYVERLRDMTHEDSISFANFMMLKDISATHAKEALEETNETEVRESRNNDDIEYWKNIGKIDYMIETAESKLDSLSQRVDEFRERIGNEQANSAEITENQKLESSEPIQNEMQAEQVKKSDFTESPTDVELKSDIHSELVLPSYSEELQPDINEQKRRYYDSEVGY